MSVKTDRIYYKIVQNGSFTVWIAVSSYDNKMKLQWNIPQ